MQRKTSRTKTGFLGIMSGEGVTMFKRKRKPPAEEARAMSDFQSVKTDPQGSWTGVPDDPHDVPVQDADDL